jgi:hypothetical protein
LQRRGYAQAHSGNICDLRSRRSSRS